jgi:MoaA/NifB/PqqE/SkfB family radical SAM enzyme
VKRSISGGPVEGEGLTGKCGRCDYTDVCRGCRKRALFSSGDWMGEDPACTYDPPPGAGHAHMAGK